MTRALVVVLVAGLSFLSAAPARAQDPKVAGTDVPAPRRTKFVAPAYPADAQMRGLRGIVILELVVDEQGRVATADVIRSVPPFDEAALSAARQWEYEVTRVEGRPVRVRVTVPITFALKLPEMTREDGIPQMRQGASPGFPPGLSGPARVVADVILQPDGSVAEASVTSGESPWAEGLLLALRTWRFETAPEGVEVGFTVEAEFVSPARTGQPPRVDLRLTKPRRREVGVAETSGEDQPPASDASAPADPAPAAEEEAAATPEVEAPEVEAPETAVPEVATPQIETPEPTGTPVAEASPEAGASAPQTATPEAGTVPPAPPVEVISGPPIPPAPPSPPQPGFSAVRDVSLGAGVPDLVKGRRPVVPPVARMAGAGGEVTVSFSIDAAGITSVQKVEGPALLQEAARQAVASWTFRRTTPDRMFLSAAFAFQGDEARADVRRAE